MIAAEHDFVRLAAEAFRQASWRVHRPRQAGTSLPDMIVDGPGRKFVVALKRASEGRRDRVIPLLSQAILEAQTIARDFPEMVNPVAIVGAEYFPPAVVDSALAYASRVAPHVGVGLVDTAGLRAFWGLGLEALNALPSPQERRARRRVAPPPLPQLFSDLNQWMLKILLAGSIPAELLSAPRSRFATPSGLARAAGVSVMSAIRLMRQLEHDGFIHPDHESLELIRVPDLLRRWSASRESTREFPVRWMLKQHQTALSALLKSNFAAAASTSPAPTGRRRPPRVCLGLFSAADALGFGFVHGVAPHIYMERLEPGLLSKWGLTLDGAEHNPDAWIRIPTNPEAIFRAAVVKDGVPCADILQVWFDVSKHPSRGKAQADEIARRALAPLLRRG